MLGCPPGRLWGRAEDATAVPHGGAYFRLVLFGTLPVSQPRGTGRTRHCGGCRWEGRGQGEEGRGISEALRTIRDMVTGVCCALCGDGRGCWAGGRELLWSVLHPVPEGCEARATEMPGQKEKSAIRPSPEGHPPERISPELPQPHAALLLHIGCRARAQSAKASPVPLLP